MNTYVIRWSLCTNNARPRCLWSGIISVTYASTQKWQVRRNSETAPALARTSWSMLRSDFGRYTSTFLPKAVSPGHCAWPRAEAPSGGTTSVIVGTTVSPPTPPAHQKGLLTEGSRGPPRATECTPPWQVPCSRAALVSPWRSELRCRSRQYLEPNPCRLCAGNSVAAGPEKGKVLGKREGGRRSSSESSSVRGASGAEMKRWDTHTQGGG